MNLLINIIMTIGITFREHLLKVGEKLVWIFICFICSSCVTQKANVCNECQEGRFDSISGKCVYRAVDQFPQYKDMSSMDLVKYIVNKISEEISTSSYEIPDRLNLEFVVDSNGNVCGARIRGKDFSALSPYEMCAIQVLSNLGKWSPGVVNGKKVNVLMTMMIHISPQKTVTELKT